MAGGAEAPAVAEAALLVERLRAGVAPAVDRPAVDAVFAAATAGCGGPRGRDGRRASALTPSGAPVEASVTGGARASDVVRYTADPASGSPFFGPRLAGQRRALAALVDRLPPAAGAAATELGELVATLFPDVAAVPARTRFATFLGVVHAADAPGHLAAVKLYGNLRATDPDAAWARVAAR